MTIDEDFRGRWVRSGLLKVEGVEVINFVHEVAGLKEQHRRITNHLPVWIEELERHPYLHRVWLQHKYGKPMLQEGKKRRSRSRTTKRPPMSDLIERGRRTYG